MYIYIERERIHISYHAGLHISFQDRVCCMDYNWAVSLSDATTTFHRVFQLQTAAY
jgi:hypothetical protein